MEEQREEPMVQRVENDEQTQQEPQQEPQPGADQGQNQTDGGAVPAPDTAPPAEGENQ